MSSSFQSTYEDDITNATSTVELQTGAGGLHWCWRVKHHGRSTAYFNQLFLKVPKWPANLIHGDIPGWELPDGCSQYFQSVPHRTLLLWGVVHSQAPLGVTKLGSLENTARWTLPWKFTMCTLTSETSSPGFLTLCGHEPTLSFSSSPLHLPNTHWYFWV